MNNNMINIRDVACRLLTPNDTLDVRLFDIHDRMHPEVRKALLGNASYIINKCFRDIAGLKVYDIFLTGSSAGYFYSEKSDIDMRIELHNENCPYLATDEKTLNRFFSNVFHGACRGYRFQTQNRFVDVTITAASFEIIGLYSILQDKWILKPDKHITDGLDVEDIINEYHTKYREITGYVESMHKNGELTTWEGLKKLEECYVSLISGSNASIREYVVYKLLNYKGVHWQIKETLSNALKKYLTVEC